MPGDGEHLAEFQTGLRDPTPSEHPRWRCGKAPIGDFAVLVLNVQIEPDMRIGPLQLGEHAGELDGLGGIELRGVGVVPKDRGRGEKQKACDTELAGHDESPSYQEVSKDSKFYRRAQGSSTILPRV